MRKLAKKILIGDYHQLLNYSIRKQIITYIKTANYILLEKILESLIAKDLSVTLDKDITTITILDEGYSFLLKMIYDPPLVLYCKGNVELLAYNKLAVVGNRHPKSYSLQAVKKIITDLSKKRTIVAITSGLALGIDGMAHRLALKMKLPTIAILGYGFDYLYPKENGQLLLDIMSQGLVVSEYPPHVGVNRWQFIARNRIIASFCNVVIIIEAKAKSGSLITAELALNENREVFIVSGKSFDTAYWGAHRLIQEGARLLLDVDEIMHEYKNIQNI